MSLEHQRLLARIRNHEDEKQSEPPEALLVTPSLASFIEASTEYLEDPKNLIARNTQGRIIRLKLKLTLSFKSTEGGGTLLKNTQITLGLPTNVWSEQTVYKIAEMDFGKSHTPHVVQMYLYPMKNFVPIDH